MVRPWLGPTERAVLDAAAGCAPGVSALLRDVVHEDRARRAYAREVLVARRSLEAVGPLFEVLAVTEPDRDHWDPGFGHDDGVQNHISRLVTGSGLHLWRWFPGHRGTPPAPECVPLLLRYGGHQVPRVRALALTLLGRAADPDHLGVFAAATGDPDGDTREAALVTLGRLDHPAARDILADVLTEPSRSLTDREIAAVMLGRAGDRRAFEALVLLLNHCDGIRNVAAAEALTRLGDPRTARAAAALATNRLRIGYALAAVHLLGRLRAPESLPALTSTLTWLMDEGRTVYQAAAGCVEELGRLGDARAVPVLNRAVADPRLRVAAVDSLGRIGGPHALETLLGVATDEDAEVRAAAARGLARYEDESRATAALVGLCAPPYPRRIVRALVRSGDPAAVAVLAAAREEAPSATTRRLAGRFRPDPSRTAAP
ncbi:HEAT repeat domain-containing protein [Streptomyces sp. PA03-6a]|nr:HEAT repeat domain-containing protein [Streptomyces sp. PA03-6a]